MALRLAFTVLLAASALALPQASTPIKAKVCPAALKHIPTFYNDALPDPFLFDDGSPVTTRAEWDCRRTQISTLLQNYELGVLPGKPPRFSHTFVPGLNSTGNLTINAGKGDADISFTVTIQYPAPGVGKAPYPAVLVFDFITLPIPPEVAVIVVDVDTLAQENDQSSRGVGLFYDLYGQGATASSLMAWTWGVSRIIDALEASPKANINTGKLALTGCSRWGKGALVAGAFEPRIALTIPQESGSGGDTCWRLSKYEQDSGDDVQQATEIVQENVWFSTLFDAYVYNISALPYDHHMLAGLIAPRALFSLENTAVEWLSPLSAFGCMTAAHKIWEALRVPEAHSFNQVGNHSHCVFPESQVPLVAAYFEKFLLDEEVETDFGVYSNHQFNGTKWVASEWINWTAPALA